MATKIGASGSCARVPAMASIEIRPNATAGHSAECLGTTPQGAESSDFVETSPPRSEEEASIIRAWRDGPPEQIRQVRHPAI